MKKMKQFEDATLELILFGFDVLTTSGEEGVESYGEFNDSDSSNSNVETVFSD